MKKGVEWNATFGDFVKKVRITWVQGSYDLYVDNRYWGSFVYYNVNGERTLLWPRLNNTILYSDDITELLAIIRENFNE